MVSYGQFPASDFLGSWKTTGNERSNTIQQVSTTGADFLTARYFLYSCLSVGVAAGYLNQQGNIKQRSGFQYVTTSTYERRAITIAIEVNYIYTISKYVDVYTYAGTGPSFRTSIAIGVASPISRASDPVAERSDAFVFHYCPLGIRVGGKVGGFGELGFGYKGLVSAGLSVRFGHRWCSKK